jgi:hypothetical protein
MLKNIRGNLKGIDMADTWVTDITHFLDEKGEMITEPPQARKLGEYLAAIIVYVILFIRCPL